MSIRYFPHLYEILDLSRKLIMNDNRSDFKIPVSSVSAPTTPSDSRGKKLPGRKVNFPSDDSVVSGYLDPPNPWRNVSEFTSEDVITSYTQACEKLGLKPLPRLIQQLEDVNNFENRVECLSLRGEKLDSKHCETLEEILKRIRFQTIDLEAAYLEDEGAVAIFDMLEYYESATKLNISFNKNIGLRGWQACARMLKKTLCVEYLDARNTLLSEQILPILGRTFRLGTNVHTIHFENCGLSGKPLLILIAALKLNVSVRELFLADNKLVSSDAIQLSHLLKANSRLQLLDLRNNSLQDSGLSHLVDGLTEQVRETGLQTLVLWCNQITYQGMNALSKALLYNNSLQTLNMGHNNITNEGVHRIKDALIKNRVLLRLGLQSTKISCEGAVALAEYIADNPKILRLDLRENEIRTAGLMALSLSMKVNKSIVRLDLDRDSKKEMVKEYLEQNIRLFAEISELCKRNKELSQEAEEKRSLEKEENKVPEIIEEFTESLIKPTSLGAAVIHHHPFSPPLSPCSPCLPSLSPPPSPPISPSPPSLSPSESPPISETLNIYSNPLTTLGDRKGILKTKPDLSLFTNLPSNPSPSPMTLSPPLYITVPCPPSPNTGRFRVSRVIEVSSSPNYSPLPSPRFSPALSPALSPASSPVFSPIPSPSSSPNLSPQPSPLSTPRISENKPIMVTTAPVVNMSINVIDITPEITLCPPDSCEKDIETVTKKTETCVVLKENKYFEETIDKQITKIVQESKEVKDTATVHISKEVKIKEVHFGQCEIVSTIEDSLAQTETKEKLKSEYQQVEDFSTLIGDPLGVSQLVSQNIHIQIEKNPDDMGIHTANGLRKLSLQLEELQMQQQQEEKETCNSPLILEKNDTKGSDELKRELEMLASVTTNINIRNLNSGSNMTVNTCTDLEELFAEASQA